MSSSHTKITPTVADDYGMSQQVNEAILKELKAHPFTIVSILANLVTPSDLQKLLKHQSTDLLSLHFNFTRGKPLAPVSKVPSLVDNNGNFYPTYLQVLRLFLHKTDLAEVKIEFGYQLRKLHKAKIHPQYLDSEQHIHTFAPIWNILDEVCSETPIKFIRSYQSSEVYLRRKPTRWLVYNCFQAALYLVYGVRNTTSRTYDAELKHPGTTIDDFSFF